MSLFQQLTEKPWLPTSFEDRKSIPPARLGLRFFIGVASVLFFLLAVAYAERMSYESFRPLPDGWLMYSNTVLLVLSSVALQYAKMSAQRDQLPGVKRGLLVGALFTYGFLAGQLWAWYQLSQYSNLATTSPANPFFYMITTLHGIHLLGGLVAWGRTVDRVWRGADVAKVRLSVELCATYWHFMLVIWTALFVLLFLPGGSLPILCRAFT